MTPASVVVIERSRSPIVLDEETIAAVESEYAEAMHHLIDPEEDEGPPERGTSEYCHPTGNPGADEEEPTRH